MAYNDFVVIARHEKDDQDFTLDEQQIDELGVDVRALLRSEVFRFEKLDGWCYSIRSTDE